MLITVPVLHHFMLTNYLYLIDNKTYYYCSLPSQFLSRVLTYYHCLITRLITIAYYYSLLLLFIYFTYWRWCRRLKLLVPSQCKCLSILTPGTFMLMTTHLTTHLTTHFTTRFTAHFPGAFTMQVSLDSHTWYFILIIIIIVCLLCLPPLVPLRCKSLNSYTWCFAELFYTLSRAGTTWEQ